MDVDLVVRNTSELVTPVGHTAQRGKDLARVERIPGAALVAFQGNIVAVGPEDEVLASSRLVPSCVEVDARGGCVLPGFVDPHTHAVFGSPRAAEYAARLEGRSYVEIAQSGGGIHASVRELRGLEESELVQRSIPRLRRMLSHGTTTVEIKSGYGLRLEDELKTLRVVRSLGQQVPQTLVPTFLGAHELPSEYEGRRLEYVRLVENEMIPAVSGLAEYNDVFCEPSVFTLEESERILRAGLAHGLAPKVHADELESFGATELACRLGAVSADHLTHVSETGVRALGSSATVAVLLPATSLGLGSHDYAPARRILDAGGAVALATDFNPGSSYCESMQAVWSLACSMLRLTPAEGLVACTLNAAAAVGRADRYGSLEAGKRCDLLVLQVPDYREVPYHFGVNDVRCVVVGGRVVWTDPDGDG